MGQQAFVAVVLFAVVLFVVVPFLIMFFLTAFFFNAFIVPVFFMLHSLFKITSKPCIKIVVRVVLFIVFLNFNLSILYTR